MTDAEKLQLLIKSGRTMRQAQNDYFKSKSKTALDRATKAERYFDRTLESISLAQENLFDGD